jgi:hypothetical protein
MRRTLSLWLLAVAVVGGRPLVLQAEGEEARLRLRPGTGEEVVALFPGPGVALSRAAARDAAGGIVAAWVRVDTSGGSQLDNVYARLLDAQGRPAGPVFQVNDEAGNQQSLVVARNAAGEFVVVWVTMDADGATGVVHAQRYAADGVRMGEVIDLTADIAADLLNVGIDDNGDFLVTWNLGNGTIFLRRFDHERGLMPIVQPVASTTADFSNVVMRGDGSYELEWSTTPQGTTLMAQNFNAAGDAAGAPFVIASGPPTQFEPAATETAGGGIAYAWNTAQCGGELQPPCTIQARFFDRSGRPFGPAVSVSGAADFGSQPSIATDTQGNVAIGWQRCTLAGSVETCYHHASIYSARGTLLAPAKTVLVEHQIVGPTLVAAAFGFLDLLNESGPGGNFPGMYAWPFLLH